MVLYFSLFRYGHNVMGYWSPSNNSAIKNFSPDDGENHFYIRDSATLADIMQRATDKWGDIGFDRIDICPEHIHTRCLTYDLHDPSDYDNFLLISKIDA